MRSLAALAVVAGLTGCGEAEPTRIDGSSPAAFARSTARAREDLPAADRLTFDAAIATVPARRYSDRDPQATARTAFDGLTAAQVVATESGRTKGMI